MRYQSTVGLDRDEITELVGRVNEVVGCRPRGGGRRPRLGLYRQVVLVLLHLRHNVPQMMLADLFGVSQPTVSRIYRAIMPLLDQVLCLSEPELTSVFRNREVLVDGTDVPIGNRANGTHNYSGKRRRQGLNVQVAATTDGTLLAVSRPLPGSRHDRRAIAECGWEPVLDQHMWIADAGYLGTTATIPYKRSKYHDLTSDEKIFNRALSTRRSPIERAIAHLKNWKILATGYRGQLQDLPTIIRIAARLELYRLGW
jgi:hypothetical protein